MPLAPLQKLTPRQRASAAAVSDGDDKPVPVLDLNSAAGPTVTLDDSGEAVTLVNPVEVPAGMIDLTTGGSSDGGDSDVPAAAALASAARSDATSTLPPIAGANSGDGDASAAGGAELSVAMGAIVGDEDHLFWRKNLECHVRVWELAEPACYAAQLHTVEGKRPLGAVYFNKQRVDEALDNNYILSGRKSQNTQARFTIGEADLRKGANQAASADSVRLARHREQVMQVCMRNLQITDTPGTPGGYTATLPEAGGVENPLAFHPENPGGLAPIQPRKFEASKPSRQQIIDNFNRVAGEFTAQMDTVQASTNGARRAKLNSSDLMEATDSMTSPAKMHAILDRVRRQAMFKLKAVSAFNKPRTTL
jgi:hypothetical protein